MNETRTPHPIRTVPASGAPRESKIGLMISLGKEIDTDTFVPMAARARA